VCVRVGGKGVLGGYDYEYIFTIANQSRTYDITSYFVGIIL